MPDVFTPEKRYQVMARVRSRDTGAEQVVRRLLIDMGRRYRLNRRDLPGSPDLAFIGRKLAIFVHGCFWHGHDCPRGARAPRSNAAYWRAKIDRNRSRDAAALEALSQMGWRSLVIWECELRDRPAVTERLRAALD